MRLYKVTSLVLEGQNGWTHETIGIIFRFTLFRSVE